MIFLRVPMAFLLIASYMKCDRNNWILHTLKYWVPFFYLYTFTFEVCDFPTDDITEGVTEIEYQLCILGGFFMNEISLILSANSVTDRWIIKIIYVVLY